MNALTSVDDTAVFDEDSDQELVERSRTGDARAFAELWCRHSDAAIAAARRFTRIDAEDLVSEAYTRIYRALLDGGGPTGPFRPYLYATVRNIASRWGRRSTEVTLDRLAEMADPDASDDTSLDALDLSLTAVAFSRLPDRWRSVLWYTEVQQMNPQDVAPILGLTPNTVAALSYRARDGLRKEWLQAHIKESGATGDCRWTLSRAGDFTAGGLSRRTRARVRNHLHSCARCSLIVTEVDEVRSGLAMALIPALIGGGLGGGALLASIGPAGAASAAGLASWLAAPAAVAGVIALSVGLSGVVPSTHPHSSVAAPFSISAPATSPTPSPVLDGHNSTPIRVTVPISAGKDSDPSGGGKTSGGSGTGSSGSGGSGTSGDHGSTGSSPSGTDDPAPAAPLVAATISLNVAGTGTPGASVALRALGIVYASTTIGADGTFALSVTALPSGIGSLQLVQTANKGLVTGLLGTVTSLVGSLVTPLALTSGGAPGVSISLVN